MEYMVQRPTSWKISHRWETYIQTVLTGSEKRSAILDQPFVEIGPGYVSGDYQTSSDIRGKLFRGSHELWKVPIWCDRTYVATTASGGSSSVVASDTTNRRFYENRDAMLIQSNLSVYEYVTISGISGNTITFTTDIAATYPAGSYILPAYEFRLDENNTITRKVREFDTWNMSFVEAYESDRDYLPTPTTWSGTTYSGIDVFEWAPNDFLKFKNSHPYELLKYYGKGIEYSWLDEDESVLSIEGSYIQNSRENIWDIFKFFDSKMGRYDRFWLPTWNKDYVITAPYTSTDTTLTVSSNFNYVYYDDTTIVNKHLMFRFPDGSKAYREITTASGSTITLNEAIGKTEPIRFGTTYVSFLVLSRFDIDQITATYQMEEIASFPLYFKGIIDEAL